MKNAKKCKKLKFKIMLIYTCSKAKISRRIRFWSQNWAIFNRFLAKWNFSYFLWFFVFFWKSFRNLIWNRFFRRTLLFLEAICKFWWTCSSKNLVSYFPDECQAGSVFCSRQKIICRELRFYPMSSVVVVVVVVVVVSKCKLRFKALPIIRLGWNSDML